MAATDYLVFKEMTNDGAEWAIVGTYKAASGDAAKQQAALAFGDNTYAATPARGWQPTPFKVQQVARAVKES